MTTLIIALALTATARPASSNVDADRDGVHIAFDQCPDVAEDLDDDRDDDGCPEPTRVQFRFADPEGSALIPKVTVLGVGPLPARRGIHVPLDAGSYVLTTELHGYLPIETRVQVPTGATATLSFVLEPTGDVSLLDCRIWDGSGRCVYGVLRQGVPGSTPQI